MLVIVARALVGTGVGPRAATDPKDGEMCGRTIDTSKLLWSMDRGPQREGDPLSRFIAQETELSAQTCDSAPMRKGDDDRLSEMHANLQ